MPYPAIDPRRLQVFPLSQRRNLLRFADEAGKTLAAAPPADAAVDEQIGRLAQRILAARQRGAAVMLDLRRPSDQERCRAAAESPDRGRTGHAPGHARSGHHPRLGIRLPGRVRRIGPRKRPRRHVRLVGRNRPMAQSGHPRRGRRRLGHGRGHRPADRRRPTRAAHRGATPSRRLPPIRAIRWRPPRPTCSGRSKRIDCPPACSASSTPTRNTPFPPRPIATGCRLLCIRASATTSSSTIRCTTAARSGGPPRPTCESSRHRSTGSTAESSCPSAPPS